MAIVQVRDVSADTVAKLKTRAAAEGLSLSAFLRRELERLAARPTNADVIDRIMAQDRTGFPSTEEIVAIIRETRNTS